MNNWYQQFKYAGSISDRDRKFLSNQQKKRSKLTQQFMQSHSQDEAKSLVDFMNAVGHWQTNAQDIGILPALHKLRQQYKNMFVSSVKSIYRVDSHLGSELSGQQTVHYSVASFTKSKQVAMNMKVLYHVDGQIISNKDVVSFAAAIDTTKIAKFYQKNELVLSGLANKYRKQVQVLDQQLQVLLLDVTIKNPVKGDDKVSKQDQLKQ